ncbi:MAG TPA: hypothetical protein VEL76_41445 [Gemmataceae bacterium]|nr:hypothetical protein [Gemmataceae bacterium]
MMTPPSLKIIVEGVTDAQLIRAILGDDLAKHAQFYAAQGRASLAALGQTILFHEGGPVLLVMDSDTLNPQLAAEMQSLTIAAMSGSLTSGGQFPVETLPLTSQFKVFTFIPEIEAVFFEAPEVLDRLLGKKAPQDKVREGHLIPKQVLTELLANAKTHHDYQQLLEHLDPKAQKSLATGSQASRLKATVESLLADAA